jgi:hypothetical protein
MLKEISTGYLIDTDNFCENVCNIEPILRLSDVCEFLDMFREGAVTYLRADKVSELYESCIHEDQNIYTRMALLAAKTIITMFEEKLLPEEGVFTIDYNWNKESTEW